MAGFSDTAAACSRAGRHHRSIIGAGDGDGDRPVAEGAARVACPQRVGQHQLLVIGNRVKAVRRGVEAPVEIPGALATGQQVAGP